MYLIQGSEPYFINQETKKITDKLMAEYDGGIEIIKFYEKVDLDSLSDALNDQDIFFTPKVIVLTNIDFLNGKKNTNKKEALAFLELLLSSDQSSNTIIIQQEIYKYDKNFTASNTYKSLQSKCKVINVEKLNEKSLYKFVRDIINQKGGNIDEQALIEFVSMMPNNLMLIESEIDKFLIANKHITIDTINNNHFFMSNNIEFAISDALIKYASKDKILLTIKEALNYGLGLNLIISQIGSVLKDAKYIYLLKKITEKSLEKIASELNIHAYRAKLLYEFINKASLVKVDNLIKFLANLDLDLKSGKTEENVALNLLQVNLII
ncbi:DNA polymerase III subunit delta [[Mycoplasma] falconis]|nr:DNA polymerase III subunit delta [[Mycoplasma] falconis]